MEIFELIEAYTPEYGDLPVKIRREDFRPGVDETVTERAFRLDEEAGKLLELKGARADSGQNENGANTSLPKVVSQGLTDQPPAVTEPAAETSSNTGNVGTPTRDLPADKGEAGQIAPAQPAGTGSAATGASDAPPTPAKPLSKAERKAAAKLAAAAAAQAINNLSGGTTTGEGTNTVDPAKAASTGTAGN